MKYLIVGNKGQLGKEFQKHLSTQNIDFVGVDIDELDISNIQKVLDLFNSVKPNYVINCAAYNQVDNAEIKFYDCLKSNTFGVRNLAYACKKFNSFFIHYGTDYIFDGSKQNDLYNEDDQPNPLNNYGKSKLYGELAIPEEIDNYLIFRVSWVFGEGNQNFIFKLMNWVKNSEYLKIAVDEVSVPTSTATIVKATMLSLKNEVRGLYHLPCSNNTSRFEWAKFILDNAKINKFIYPVSKDSFNLPAKRPSFSAMSNKKISDILNIEIPTWQQETEKFLDKVLTLI